MSALDKVLALAGAEAEPYTEDDAAVDLIRAAAEDLNELALLLADDGDDDGEGDYDEDEDEDEDDEAPKGKKKPPFGKKKGKSKKSAKQMAYSARASELVLCAMTALSHLQGGDVVSLSVLSQAQREKPSAHTIGGSTDYPIPDKAHLAAAIARYKQGKLAGHSAREVAAHIRSRARALGETVELSELEDDRAVFLAGRPWLPLKQFEAAHPFKNNFGAPSAPKAPAAPAAPKTPGPPKPPGSTSAKPSSGAGGAKTSSARPAQAAGARKSAGAAARPAGRFSGVQHRMLSMHQWHQAHLAHLQHMHAMHLQHLEHMEHLRGQA